MRSMGDPNYQYTPWSDERRRQASHRVKTKRHQECNVENRQPSIRERAVKALAEMQGRRDEAGGIVFIVLASFVDGYDAGFADAQEIPKPAFDNSVTERG